MSQTEEARARDVTDDELRLLARLARENGGWHNADFLRAFIDGDDGQVFDDADIAFIVACSPDVVLRLLEARSSAVEPGLRTALERMREFADHEYNCVYAVDLSGTNGDEWAGGNARRCTCGFADALSLYDAALSSGVASPEPGLLDESALAAILARIGKVDWDPYAERKPGMDHEYFARSLLAALPRGVAADRFTGQMTWPCTCGHPKSGHYFGDGLDSEGRMHTSCQHGDGCHRFTPAARPRGVASQPPERECPECEGHGWVAKTTADPLPSGEPGEPYQVQETCSLCGGDGTLPDATQVVREFIAARGVASQPEPLDIDGGSDWCGDPVPHEPHSDEGTANATTFVHACPGSPERRAAQPELDVALLTEAMRRARQRERIPSPTTIAAEYRALTETLRSPDATETTT